MKKEDLHKIYNGLVEEATEMWNDGCIQEEQVQGQGLPRLVARVGITENAEILTDVEWVYNHMTGESEEWYKSKQISVLEDDFDSRAVDASDYLYEDEHYKKTGEISDEVLAFASSEFKLEFISENDFVDIVLELLSKEGK